MGRPLTSYPTQAEFQLLQILWNHSYRTVRDIADELKKTKKIAYTSIATIVRIMVEKKYVELTDVRRPQRFRAVITREAATKAMLISHVLGELFLGDRQLLLRAVVDGLYDGNPGKAATDIAACYTPAKQPPSKDRAGLGFPAARK